ncbi:Zn-ribbon domain-containing OB-fold protein [Rhodococcus kronopolitis]|uniref:Zn-ribbon domain-containing OB-fold protein n=1 Tax=Rhodococcus kronopolitis TaxID=1460226 RepID=A0ABV9FLF3_9NOCA
MIRDECRMSHHARAETSPADDPPAALMIRCCTHCETRLAPDAWSCTGCDRCDLSWLRSSGTGWIVSRTVVELPPHRGRHPVPCTIAVVALDDGPWVCAWIEGAAANSHLDPIRVRFDHSDPGERYPCFVRCAA